MRRIWNSLATACKVLASVAALTIAAGCNSGNGDCPDKVAITPGASCSDEHLQCAFDLTTPAAACDGTSAVIATSCMCTSGVWSCPSAFVCEGGTDAAGDDASAGGNEAGEAGDVADSGVDAAD